MTLVSHMALVESLPGHRDFTSEFKPPPIQVPMTFNGYTQEQCVRDMHDTFVKRRNTRNRVWPQSFNPPDMGLSAIDP